MRNGYHTLVEPDFVDEISEPTRLPGSLGTSTVESLGIVQLLSAKLWLTISHHKSSVFVNLATAMPEPTAAATRYKPLISVRTEEIAAKGNAFSSHECKESEQAT